MALHSILVATQGLVAGAQVAEGSTLLQVVVLWVGQGWGILQSRQLLLEVAWKKT